MPKTIAVIGAGRVGQTLARALRRRGYHIGQVVAASRRSTEAAARFIGGGQARVQADAGAAAADILLIATQDRVIGEAAHRLAHLEVDWRRKAVLHTSGSLSSRDLGVLQEQGAAVGSLHPLYPFSEPVKAFPRGVFFGVEGDRRAVKEAEAIVRTLGGRALRVRAEEKPLYHAAAALVAGHLMTLVDLGARMFVRAGVPALEAREALLPLALATLESYAEQGPRAWTGPLRRGDAETVWHHLVALKKLPPAYLDAYIALGRAALALYRTDRSRTTKELRRLLEA